MIISFKSNEPKLGTLGSKTVAHNLSAFEMAGLKAGLGLWPLRAAADVAAYAQNRIYSTYCKVCPFIWRFSPRNATWHVSPHMQCGIKRKDEVKLITNVRNSVSCVLSWSFTLQEHLSASCSITVRSIYTVLTPRSRKGWEAGMLENWFYSVREKERLCNWKILNRLSKFTL